MPNIYVCRNPYNRVVSIFCNKYCGGKGNILSKNKEFKLNKKQLETAKMAGYYEFIMMNNYDKRLELGGQRFIPGGEVNFNKMLNEILSENNVKLQDQYIYKTLKDFIESSSKRVLL